MYTDGESDKTIINITTSSGDVYTVGEESSDTSSIRLNDIDWYEVFGWDRDTEQEYVRVLVNPNFIESIRFKKMIDED